MSESSVSSKIDRVAMRTLCITSLVGFMVAMEITIISVAREEMAAAFPSASAATLSWTITAYNIGVASLLLPAGWLADRYGRKRIFLWGLATFLVGSLLSGVAPTSGLLIAARVLQSIGGAAQFPAGLALLLMAVPAERRQSAIGIWAAVSGLAAALAPSVGALLVDVFGWRAVFLVNVPVAAFAFVAGRFWLSESKGEGVSNRVDLVSVPMASLGIGALLFAMVQGKQIGLVGSLVAISVGLLMLTVFVRRSLTHQEPLFDLRLFQLRSFTVANIGSVFFIVAFFGWLIVLPEFLQRVWGWSVLKSGFAIAPGPVISAILSATNGRLADRIGNRPIVIIGGAAGFIACLLHFIFTTSTPDYVVGILIPGVFMGIAAGCSFAMLIGAAMSEIPPARFGMGGAGRTTVFQLSTALGVGLAITIVGDNQSVDTLLYSMQRVWIISAVLFCAQSVLFVVFYRPKIRR